MKHLICRIFGHRWYEAIRHEELSGPVFIGHACNRCGLYQALWRQFYYPIKVSGLGR